MQAPDVDNTHNIFIYGVIGWDMNVQSLFRELNNIPSGVTNLDFYYHTPGGLLSEGLALLTNMNRLKKDYYVRNHIDGMAASMGSALVVTGHETIASPTSEMMIHDPRYNLDIYGGFNRSKIEDLIEQLEDIHEELDNDTDVIAYPYAIKTGMSVQEVRDKWLEDGKDHWLTPSMMLEAGLIDRIAEEEFVKPPEVEEEEEEDWLTGLMTDMKAAVASGREIDPYVGKNQKLVQTFAFQPKNSDHQNNSDPDSKSAKQQKSAMDELKVIARQLNLNPEASAQVIRDTVAQLQSDLQEKEKTINSQQELIDQYKTTKNENETKIANLEEELRDSKCGSVVDEVVADVTKNVEGKDVNKNIKPKLEALAAQHLEAKSKGNDTVAENMLDHMKLLAKDSLIPIGKNPELADGDKGSSRKDTGAGGLSTEALEKAQKEGEKALEKEKKRRQMYQNQN